MIVAAVDHTKVVRINTHTAEEERDDTEGVTSPVALLHRKHCPSTFARRQAASSLTHMVYKSLQNFPLVLPAKEGIQRMRVIKKTLLLQSLDLMFPLTQRKIMMYLRT